jgi:phosphate acetyltransferase/phosphate butyryltransferase
LLALIERAQAQTPMTTAVVYPREASALKATLDAAAFGLIRPVLYGPVSELRTVAAKAELDLAADTR